MKNKTIIKKGLSLYKKAIALFIKKNEALENFYKAEEKYKAVKKESITAIDKVDAFVRKHNLTITDFEIKLVTNQK